MKLKAILPYLMRIVSFLLEISIVACAIEGVRLTAEYGNEGFLYFTVQSNIWIAVVCLMTAIIQIIYLILRKGPLPGWLRDMKIVFTVAITLTGLVFCAVLAPTTNDPFGSMSNVLTHVVVPVLSIIDLFLTKNGKPSYKVMLWTTIPPLYYLGFASLGYVLNWDFGGGLNYPYFFLNWGSSAGAFGFGQGLYFMGTFYWIILLLLVVVGFSALYVFLLRLIEGKKKETATGKAGK